jgi:hypothetical protein
MFSQVWNRKAWLAPTAIPSSTPTDALVSVSCASGQDCLAVGGSSKGQLSENWNGRTWRALPAPPGSGQSDLDAVACPAAGQCIAVGASPLAEPGATQAWAQQWNGTSWTKLAPVVPAGATSSVLNAISCPGSSDCVATGMSSTDNGDVRQALAESWNGSSWTVLPTPPRLTELNAVSCPTAAECVVVGQAIGKQPVGSAVWNGSTWTSLTTPSPSPALKPSGRSLTGVSCVSARSCIAVGSGYSSFADQWTGGTGWKLLSVPNPLAFALAPGGERLPFYNLSAVSCTGAARCIAVGGDFDGSLSSYASFAVSWNGSTWSVLPTGRVDGLMGVSCSSVSRCLITGAYLTKADQTRTLTEAWNGKTMRLISGGSQRGVSSAVSCLSSSFCMAAGEGGDIDRWDGTGWTRTSSNLPTFNSNDLPRLNQLSCGSKKNCMAVGEGPDFPEAWFGTLGEAWNGSKWEGMLLPAPSGTDAVTTVNGLSCRGAAFCLAVGSWYQDTTDGASGTLAEVWNGARWRVIASPSSGKNDSFNAASCVTSTDCMVLGAAHLGSGAVRLAAERWNGRHWQTTQIPYEFRGGPWTGGVVGPSGISCSTATSCMVVGSHGPLGSMVDVALTWNGHRWRKVKVAGPGGLSTVSCAAPDQCLAIGTPGIRTLAKAWNGRTWRVVTTINP